MWTVGTTHGGFSSWLASLINSLKQKFARLLRSACITTAPAFTYRSDLMVRNLGSTDSDSMVARAIWGSAHSLISVWSELGTKPPVRARWWLKELTQ